jgi:hypothetical protein
MRHFVKLGSPKMIQSIIALATLPFMFLNIFAGIGGGIWLLILGQYKPVVIGIGLIIIGRFITGFLLMPGLIFLAPLMANERMLENKLVSIPILVLSTAYTYCVMGAWALAIFFYFPRYITTYDAFTPIILLSYAASTGIWNYMAQQEARSGNDKSGFSAFFHQLSCVALMVYIYKHFQYPDLQDMAIWYAIPMSVALLVQVSTILMLRPSKYQ